MGGPLRDRRVVITGGNSGIGLEAARALAAAGAEVVIAGRNPEKVAAAVEEVAGFVPGARLATVTVDLADLTAVAAAADELHDRFDRIDVLINNAGVMAVPLRHSADGFELHFATNHLGHFALTGQVLDLLTAAPAPRVVTVSSGMHRFADAGLANLNAENGYDKWRAYSTSKLCNLRFAFELQRRLAASGSTALSVAAHPGYAATELQRHGPRMERARVKEHAWTVFNRLFAQSARA
ncbi:MAG TPA: SDR family NAD(P)-dependent oxidoreductase, partial [Egibacteraceae bacterium]|nr:SDR family NAD(P)-dependent oxidoreductase [Egibacteraceae bacterium]